MTSHQPTEAVAATAPQAQQQQQQQATQQQKQQQQAAVQSAAFNVGSTYKVVDVIGEGAYGVVW